MENHNMSKVKVGNKTKKKSLSRNIGSDFFYYYVIYY